MPGNRSDEDSLTTSISSSETSLTAASLTSSFYDKYRATHNSMSNDKKWILPSGAIVEDSMFELGMTLNYEQ